MLTSRIASAISRIAVAITISLVMVTARTASAESIIYFYEGNALQTSGIYQCPPVCSLSGSFILDSPLEANRPLESALTPLWYDFTNGLNTFTPLTTGFGGARFFVGTDGNGTIEEWSIQLVLNSGGTQFQTWHTPSGYITPDTTGDNTSVYGCSGTPLVCAPIGIGGNNYNPGTWTSMPFSGPSPAPVPEPGTLFLMGSGLVLAARKAMLRR